MIQTNERITQSEDQHGSGAYTKRPLTIVRGQGAQVWDEAGRAYIDATAGQGVAVLGHAHPAIVEAISTQAATLITCPESFYNDQRAMLYEKLSSIMPGDLGRFFLCNSGAEAMEGALKAARILTGRQQVVATKRSFHGRTIGALSLTWNPKYREPFAPWGASVAHIAYNDLEAAREVITEETAAIIVEAVQGEGGVHPAEQGYLAGLREICDARGALLIVDEIQAGIGRTGRWFAFQHDGVIPDIVTMGKGIAGGVAMGAVCWRESLGTLPSGSHGSTFGGNPLACAASLATLSTLQNERIIEQAAEKGAWLMQALQDLNLHAVREVRGRGMMIGLELRGRVTPVLQGLQERGVLALPAGVNVLRLLPPLITTQNELETVVAAIADVLGGDSESQ